MPSQFFDMDEWEPVDIASTATTLASGGVAAPLSIGFSLFMSGEAGTPVSKDKDNDDTPKSGSALAGSPSPLGKAARSKDAFRKNIFIGMEPPKPSWVQQNY